MKAARLRGGTVSRREVAEHIEKSERTYERWENGVSRPSKADIKRVAKVLGVSYEYLAFGKEAQESPKTSQIINRIMELIDRFDQKIDKLDGDAAGTEARMLLMAIAKEIRPLAEGDQDLLDEIDHVEKNIIANAFR